MRFYSVLPIFTEPAKKYIACRLFFKHFFSYIAPKMFNIFVRSCFKGRVVTKVTARRML